MMSAQLFVGHKLLNSDQWHITESNKYRLHTPTRLATAVSFIVVRDKQTTMYFGKLPAMCAAFTLNQLTKVTLGWIWADNANGDKMGL